MKIIGITGGVGSGKSEILNILENDYHAKIIQSDHVAHELMAPGARSYDAIIQSFGNGILNEDKTINRPVLGEIVFHDEEKLSLLNSITHKNVDEEILSRIDQFGKEEPEGLVVVESALLVGAGYERDLTSYGIFIQEKKCVMSVLEHPEDILMKKLHR